MRSRFLRCACPSRKAGIHFSGTCASILCSRGRPAVIVCSRKFGWREAVLALLVALLIYQVVVPFVMIVWTSLKTARPGETEFLSLAFTLSNYLRAFGSASFWNTSGNTLA